MTPAESPPNGRKRPYQRSQFWTAKRALVKYGDRILPGPESPIGRELRDWRLALVADLGGLDVLTTQQLALVEQAVVQRFLVASLDSYVLSLPALVNKRSRCLFPIVRERAGQVALLQSLLRDLGLERRTPPAGDLRSYIAERTPPSVLSVKSVKSPPADGDEQGSNATLPSEP